MRSNRRGVETRERILEVAMEMFRADPGSPLSVRSVAAAAGLSAGSLRHAFPSQRELQDAVLSRISDVAFSDDGIDDRSVPAQDRLLACLQHLLAAVGTGSSARAAWSAVFRAYIEPDPSPAILSAQRSADAVSRLRIERWLRVLRAEGALVDGELARHTQFLCTVLNGLAFERALPSAESTLVSEQQVLRTAIGVLVPGSPPRPNG